MGRKCSVLGCRTNYAKKKKETGAAEQEPKPVVSIHTFPRNPEQRAAWIKALNRKDFTESQANNGGICSRHFHPSLISYQSADKRTDRLAGQEIQNARLADAAIPDRYLGYSPYRASPAKPSPTAATAAKLRDRAVKRRLILDEAEHFDTAVALLGSLVSPSVSSEISECSAQSVYYTCGALVHSQVMVKSHRKPCQGCLELLVDQEKEGIREIAALFTDTISRGGLIHPSDLAFNISLVFVRLWYQIRREPQNMAAFLALELSHREVFVEMCLLSLSEDPVLSALLPNPSLTCSLGHPIIRSLAKSFFNCFWKYHLIQERGAKSHQETQAELDKKAKKLQGKGGTSGLKEAT